MQYQGLTQDYELAVPPRASSASDAELMRRVAAALKDDAGLRPRLESLLCERHTPSDVKPAANDPSIPSALTRSPPLSLLTKLLPTWLQRTVEGYYPKLAPPKVSSHLERLPRELREHVYSMFGLAMKTEERIVTDCEAKFKGTGVTIRCRHQFCVNDDGVKVVAYYGSGGGKIDVASLNSLMRVNKSFLREIRPLLFRDAILSIDVGPMWTYVPPWERDQVFREYFDGLPLNLFSTIVLYRPVATPILDSPYLKPCSDVLNWVGKEARRLARNNPFDFRRNRTVQQIVFVLPNNKNRASTKKKPRGKRLQIATSTNDMPRLFSHFGGLKSITAGGHHSSIEEMKVDTERKDAMEKLGDFMAQRVWQWGTAEQNEATRKGALEIPKPLLLR